MLDDAVRGTSRTVYQVHVPVFTTAKSRCNKCRQYWWSFHDAFMIHSLNIHDAFIIHASDYVIVHLWCIYCTFIMHSWCIHYTFMIHSLNIHDAFIMHASDHVIVHLWYIYCTFIMHSWCIHYTFMIRSCHRFKQSVQPLVRHGRDTRMFSVFVSHPHDEGWISLDRFLYGPLGDEVRNGVW